MCENSIYAGLLHPNQPKSGWLVAYTAPNSEFLVNIDLLARGFEVYLPVTEKQRNNVLVRIPLFSRYLFVRCDYKQHLLKNIRGITTIVSFGTDFAVVSDLIIEKLRALETGEWPSRVIPTIKKIDAANVFAINELITIIAGPHQGLRARFNKSLNKGRAQLTWGYARLNVPITSISKTDNGRHAPN